MKVYNTIVLNSQKDSEDEGEDEEVESDSEMSCLQELTRNLKETSKARQAMVSKFVSN